MHATTEYYEQRIKQLEQTIADISRRHYSTVDGEDTVCGECYNDWPCLTAQLCAGEV